MADKSYNEIPNLSEDWGLDPRNGLPYAGQSVQEFIKKTIREMMSEIGGKFGGVGFDGGTMRFYDTEGGKQLGAVTITGTSYSVNVVTNIPSSNFTVLTSDESYPVTLSATTTATEFGQTEGTNYPESYTYAIEVDNGMGYIDRTPENNAIAEGGTATVDLRPLLKVGTNRIRIIVTGASSNQPKTIGYTATLTSLSLRCEHPWHKAWLQGEDFAITGIFFSGNIAKKLHIKVGDTTYTQDFTASTSYDKVPTSFDLTNLTPESSGVVPIELWMTGDGVETKHIYYNIMYVATKDFGNVSLICVNNAKKTVFNFTEETLLEYAVYNVNSLTTTVKATFGETEITLLDSTQNMLAQTVYQLKMGLQIDTTETEGISLNVNLFAEGASAERTMVVDNSNAYLATAGYKFYLNTSLGNNDSADRELIQNTAILTDDTYKAVYPAIWNNYTFADDAWGRDTDGNRALVTKAGSDLTIVGLKPLQYSNTKSATFEFMYRASSIADYDKPIMTCIDTEEYDPATSVGLVVFPNRVLLLGTSVRQELFQKLPLSEDRIHHITVVIQRGYAASSLNLARIYINGCENVTFSFSGGNLFYNASGNNQVRIGQQSTDTYNYMMRIYDIALEANQVFANYLNALIETAELSRKSLREDNNITDGTQISYDLAKKAGFNCFVIEMPDDKPIPSLTYPTEYSRGVNYHLEYNDTPEWNVSIYDAPIGRQGTTSGLYEMANLTGKIKEKLRWVYHNLKDDNGNVLEELSKDGYIAGYGLNARVSRITWKKNVASQPQGHKMGATALYNDIYKRVMGGAEKLVADKILPTADSRVAVYQHPFLGFQKFANGEYKFIGLYTGGPDKKDKKTFGYNATDAFPNLMMIEGPNHDPYLTRFLVPWTEDVFYDHSAETLSVGAQSASDGAKQEGWDADIVGDYSADDANDAAAILALYESEFKPAYDAIYYNSPYIAALAETGKTLDEINADLTTFFKEKTMGYANSLMTFYNENYELVYYRVKTGRYEVLPKSTHDMLTYLGLSGTPTTGEILDARASQWLTKVGSSVNMREAYYRQIFDEFIGASDNDAKNSYWRKFLSLALGGKWGFNEDDLDTIFQNDNNGQDTKDYFVEPDDTSALGADIFQGRTSAFWFALRLHCKDQLRGMMSEVVDAMYAEAESKSLLAPTVHQTIFNLIDFYFWRHSSKYFPATAYNQDTQLAYIDVWFSDPDRVYNNVPPLTQIHGDHYETEREWVSKRIPYMFSKYQIGAFEAGAADGYGSLEFTPAEGFTMEVTPAIDLYPRVSYGGATTEVSQRTKAGETCPLVLSASGTTGNYIKAMDWLSDIGDLTDLKLSSRSAADAAIAFSVKGKRLRSLKVGDKDKTSEEIKFNAETLSVESEALEVIDARNTATVKGTLSLQKCPRTREVYTRGTSLSSVVPPLGGRVSTLELPDTIQDLVLVNLNLLQPEGLDITDTALGNIRNLYVNSCQHINPVQLLQRIYDIPDNKLTALGLIWKGWLVDDDGSALRMFGNIAEKAGIDGGYSGVDFTTDITTTALPNISGALDASGLGGVYLEDIQAIQAKLPSLLLKYNADKLYMRFADPEVLKVLLANMSGLPEGATGITTEQAAAVTSIGTWFKGNTTIQTFNELSSFIGINRIGGTSDSTAAFSECTGLEEISIPESVTALGPQAFYKCENLKKIDWHGDNISSIGERCFIDCVSLLKDVVLPKITSIPVRAFNDSGITSFSAINATTLASAQGGYGVFHNCTNLKSVDIPKVQSIGTSCFQNCTSLETVNIQSAVTIQSHAFRDTNLLEGIEAPSLTSVGERAFNNSGIRYFDAPNLTTIANQSGGYGVFQGCANLERITIENISSIGANAFHSCTLLEFDDLSLTKLTSLGQNAFRGVKIKKISNLGKITALVDGSSASDQNYGDKAVLESISIPSTVTKIPSWSFYNYTKISELIIDWSKITSIGSDAFNGLSLIEIESLSLPNLTSSIGANAFKGVKIKEISSLGSITSLPSTDYSYSTFGDKSVLEKVVLPSILKNIGNNSFYGYTALAEINLENVTTMGTAAFYGCTSLSSVIDISNVTILNNSTFENCSSLETVLFSENITSIGNKCFNNCSKLAIDVNLPNLTTLNGSEQHFRNSGILSFTAPLLTEVKSSSFNSCKGLTYVNIGDKCTTVGGNGFQNCTSLKYVEFGTSIGTFIGSSFRGCTALETFIVKNPTPPSLASDAFASTNSTFIIYVPDESVEAYKGTTNWSTYASRIKGVSEYVEQ